MFNYSCMYVVYIYTFYIYTIHTGFSRQNMKENLYR
ncbi:unnamed protein product [Brassica napus]|uniref:(rape) hypothetical protein n=1 Tax=Brassica napus TaxID=3708 RepID=A0A816I557_BRANA|nr:unnamed protein product [Brassica napus]